jgi:hypothetical protein
MGIPVERYMRAKNEELEILDAVREQGAEVLDDILTSLARKIVKEYSDAKRRGEKGR